MMMAKSQLQNNMRYKWVRLTLKKPLKRLFSEVRSLAHRSLATFCDSGQQRDPWCPSRDYLVLRVTTGDSPLLLHSLSQTPPDGITTTEAG
jgi:hypothetical protein